MFDLYYKDHLFFSHSSNKPCFEVGIGNAKYKQFHARFRIKDYIKSRIPLKDFNILSILFNKKTKINIQKDKREGTLYCL